MILTIDRVNDLLDDMADSFPAALFDGLNGGINLLEEAKPVPEFPEGEMYFLGEYCDDLLGQYINLYYGSFAALAEREIMISAFGFNRVSVGTEEQKKNMTKEQEQRYQVKKQQEESEKQVNYGVKPIN